ncbi:hypothetical protein TM239_14850 [Bradyrhizobium sp. TM239]|nr:hypothetical protein TM239_14850 [Bradyrhizobium sp. TM239]
MIGRGQTTSGFDLPCQALPCKALGHCGSLQVRAVGPGFPFKRMDMPLAGTLRRPETASKPRLEAI